MKNQRCILAILLLATSTLFFLFYSKNSAVNKEAYSPALGEENALYRALSQLSKERLLDMQLAAEEVLMWEEVLDKTGTDVAKEVTCSSLPLDKFAHYPSDDIIDHEHGCQYYYHQHREGEHGHFHVFLRRDGMPKSVLGVSSAPSDSYAHIIAISMNEKGKAIRLFTTNQWVTGETWYSAKDTAQMIDLIKIDHAYPSFPANQWISAMMRLFFPQIVELLIERDNAVMEWEATHPGDSILENRLIEILSEKTISVDKQLKMIEIVSELL